MTTTSDHIIASLSDKLGELQRENTRQVDEIARLAALVKSIDASRDAAEALNTRLSESLEGAIAARDRSWAHSADLNAKLTARDAANTPPEGALRSAIGLSERLVLEHGASARENQAPRCGCAMCETARDLIVLGKQLLKYRPEPAITGTTFGNAPIRQPGTNHDWGCPKSPGDGSCTCGFDAEKAARAAAAYLAAHAALVAAGVSEERPAAARRVADAWIALTKACAELPAGGPEQDRGAAALRPAEHAFVPHLWGKDCCDGKVDDDGRSRTCTLPREEHQP